MDFAFFNALLFGRFMNCPQRALFRFAQKSPFEETYRGERVFDEKSSISYRKHARPLKISLHDFRA
jgi:hypothetical protein